MDNTFNLTLRQRKLLHTLQNQNGFITGAALAKELRVSPRTIRSDIVAINAELAPYDACIGSEHSKGYLFAARDPQKIAQLNRIDTAYFTKEDRIRYLAFQLCLSDTPLNLFDLEDEMFISRTTLEHDLHTLRMTYTLAYPQIHLLRNGEELSYESDEKKRRVVLNHLFSEDWNYNTTGNAYYSYGFLDPDILEQISIITSGHLKHYEIRLEDACLVCLNLAISIAYHRMLSGHGLPADGPLPKPDTTAWLVCRDIFADLEGQLKCAFPESERDAVYTMLSSWQMLDAAKLSFATVPQYFGPRTIEMGNQYLQRIRQVFALDFSKDEDFYITLMQYIRYLQMPGCILNGQGNMDISKECLRVEFEIAFLFQDIYRSYQGSYLNETELIYLAHCISGAMEYFYHNHPQTKPKTVIACHLNLPATWALKRKVLGAFENFLDITDLLPVNTKSAFDFSHTDLVLTTVNKQITDHPGTYTLQISQFVTPQDHRAIEAYIQRMRLHKLYPSGSAFLPQLLSEAFFHEAITLTERFPILELMAGDFIIAHLVETDYLSDLLRRESISSFCCRSGILFVHSLVPAKKTALCIATLQQRIYWNTHKVRLLVMAAFAPTDAPMLFALQSIFVETNYPRDELKQLRTKEDVCAYFAGKREA